MFYLMMHSTHFIYGYMVLDMCENNHSDSERGNPLTQLHGLLFPIGGWGEGRVFEVSITSMPISTEGSGTPTTRPWSRVSGQGDFPISSKGSFICIIPQTV